MKGSLTILAFFTAGVLAAYFHLLPSYIIENDLSEYALMLLLVFVGISVGLNPKTWEVLKNAKFYILLVPLAAIIGSLAGAAVVSFFLPQIKLSQAIAVGSGLGCYSLSSILIAELDSNRLAVIALLANIFREIVTLLFTPLIVKYFGRIAPITVAGSTSMDTTLPIITQFSGKEYAIISIFNGTVLTILVPVLVSASLKL